MVRSARLIVMSFWVILPIAAQAQWQMQTSGTHAALRGIHSVDGTTAWASGTHGTVLRTTDGGEHWQACSVPPEAADLDFRSVWAWDAAHAMVLSSGPGKQSRLYSTHDGCRTWRPVFTDPDAEGFWDGLQFDGTNFGVILGDPVQGRFTLFATYDGGTHWVRQEDPCLRTMEAQQGAFAASNQSLALAPLPEGRTEDRLTMKHQVWFGTSGGWLYGLELAPMRLIQAASSGCLHRQVLPPTAGSAPNPAAGVFALAFGEARNRVAVGGDYAKPQATGNTAAYTIDGSDWQPAAHPPGGYRSTVAWNASEKAWVAAGPTGSDVSVDGKDWRSLDKGSWNALSLPFAVGPNGRIARLVSWGQLRVERATPSGPGNGRTSRTTKGQ